MHTHTHIDAYMHIHMHTSKHRHAHMHMHVHAGMHLCTHTHPDVSFRSALYILGNSKLLLSARHEGHGPSLMNSV